MYELIEEINLMVEKFINKNATQVTAKQLGLDPRAGNHLYVTENQVICPISRRGALDYFGGFQYVDDDQKTVVGEYVVYGAGPWPRDRVQGCLDAYENKESLTDASDD